MVIISECLDQLVNIDYNKREINKLYSAARDVFGDSLSMRAAEMILGIPKDRFVFLSTGSVTRSWVSTLIGETDGPSGTAILAKVIRLCRNAIPIILTEATLVASMEAVLRAAGLCVVSSDQALKAQEMETKGFTAVVTVLPFPMEDNEARLMAESLLEEMNPAVVICIEKADRNKKGIYHNMRGFDYSENRARIDILVNEAKSRGIPTIGIGDGGNEIGMGCISDAVRKFIPYGAKCQCPCSGGIAPITQTDLLVTGSVSNWACYAICAALALKLGNPEFLPTIEDERRMLEAAVSSGLVDGKTGKADTTVDGFSLNTNCAIIEILRAIVLRDLGRKNK